jgi:hypothetical protein
MKINKLKNIFKLFSTTQFHCAHRFASLQCSNTNTFLNIKIAGQVKVTSIHSKINFYNYRYIFGVVAQWLEHMA